MSSNITLRLSAATWTDGLSQICDGALARLERMIRNLAAEMRGEFGQTAHEVKIRRLAAHGCNGQALI